jgi:hypothetical protein
MKWIFTLSTLLSFTSTSAQQATDTYEKFCEVWTRGRNLFGYWEFYADSGQARYGWGNRHLLMRDRQGIIRFQSKMEALNYLGEQGWTLVSTHTTTEPSGVENAADVRYFYLFRKTVPKDELYWLDKEVRELIKREQQRQ